MKKVLKFISERGFTIMVGGMLTAIAGIIAYVVINTPRFAGTPFPHAALALTITGFVVYFVGRVSLHMQRRRNPPVR